jgi:hypothetical protein
MVLNRQPRCEQAQLRDQSQDAGEQASGGSGLGHLEGGSAAVADGLRAGLDCAGLPTRTCLGGEIGDDRVEHRKAFGAHRDAPARGIFDHAIGDERGNAARIEISAGHCLKRRRFDSFGETQAQGNENWPAQRAGAGKTPAKVPGSWQKPLSATAPCLPRSANSGGSKWTH